MSTSLRKDVDMARWNISVSSNLDTIVRTFLADRGEGENADLSRFVDEAARARIFALTASQTKEAMSGLDEAETNALIGEALDWARSSEEPAANKR